MMSRWPEPLARAYKSCEAIARSHDENFPVASRLLPRTMRPHIAALYAFARVADDFADEGTAEPAIRQSRLRAWQRRLHEAARGPGFPPQATSRDELIFVALGNSIRSLNLPLSLFDDLLSAFCQDTATTRYRSWTDVIDYCRRSANPVGRLVLRIAGYANDALDRSSDALCTALQLTNFWQDFGRDWRAGRLYVPRDIHEPAGASEADLLRETITASWAQALDSCAERTSRLFEEGRHVCDAVAGRLKFELRVTWLGGRMILDRVRARPTDLFRYRPTLAALDAPGLLWRAAWWTRRSG